MSPADIIVGSPLDGGGDTVPVSITSCGSLPAVWRLATLVVSPAFTPRLTAPLPATILVTSSEIVLPLLNAPEETVGEEEIGGAFDHVMPDSVHDVLATGAAVMPFFELAVATSRSVTYVIGPLSAGTSKRR